MPSSRGKQSRYGRRNCSKGHISRQVVFFPCPLCMRGVDQAGWVMTVDEKDDLCTKTLETLRKTGLADGCVEFKSGADVTMMWEMIDGPMKGEIGYFNPSSVFISLFTVVYGRAGRKRQRQRFEWLLPLKRAALYSIAAQKGKWCLYFTMIPSPKPLVSRRDLVSRIMRIKSYYVLVLGRIP